MKQCFSAVIVSLCGMMVRGGGGEVESGARVAPNWAVNWIDKRAKLLPEFCLAILKKFVAVPVARKLFWFYGTRSSKSRPLDRGLSQLNPFQSSVRCYRNVGRIVQDIQITIYETTLVRYTSLSQPLWDRGPVNSFFIRLGPGPNKFTRKYLSIFFKFIH